MSDVDFAAGYLRRILRNNEAGTIVSELVHLSRIAEQTV